MPIVRTATEADAAAAIDVIVLAFASDPASRWTWPDPHQYLRHVPNFVNAIGGKAFAHGSAHYLEGYTGAALWLPPNVQPDDDDLFSLFQRTVAEELHKDVFAVFEQMGRYHPREPYWYLPLIGVDPSRQGQGYGSALMAHGIAPCDRNRTLAYLESSSPRNIPLYKRFGFEVIGTIQVGASPPIFPMLRKPR